MDRPHDSKSWAADLVERFTSSDDLPEYDTPAEYVTLLTVVVTCCV